VGPGWDDDAGGSAEERVTFREAFDQGIYLVRREGWRPTVWIELLSVGGFMSPFGLLHSILEGDEIRPEHHLPPQEIPLHYLAPDGWLPHEPERQV